MHKEVPELISTQNLYSFDKGFDVVLVRAHSPKLRHMFSKHKHISNRRLFIVAAILDCQYL